MPSEIHHIHVSCCLSVGVQTLHWKVPVYETQHSDVACAPHGCPCPDCKDGNDWPKIPFLGKKKSLELASDLKFSQPYQGSSYIRGSLSSRPVFFSSWIHSSWRNYRRQSRRSFGQVRKDAGTPPPAMAQGCFRRSRHWSCGKVGWSILAWTWLTRQ